MPIKEILESEQLREIFWRRTIVLENGEVYKDLPTYLETIPEGKKYLLSRDKH